MRRATLKTFIFNPLFSPQFLLKITIFFPYMYESLLEMGTQIGAVSERVNIQYELNNINSINLKELKYIMAILQLRYLFNIM